MNLVTVDSSMLDAVGYDEKTQELEAVFVSGNVYRYEGVPKEVYEQLLASDSKGSFMHRVIIDCYAYYPVSTKRRRH
jgi:hypothetical protein